MRFWPPSLLPSPCCDLNPSISTDRRECCAASKPNRRRVQVVLTHAAEDSENLPHVSSDSDEIDDLLLTAHAHPAKKNWSKGQGQEQKHLVNNIGMLPYSFVLTVDCDGYCRTAEAAVLETGTLLVGQLIRP
jgi:hypothetical protein